VIRKLRGTAEEQLAGFCPTRPRQSANRPPNRSRAPAGRLWKPKTWESEGDKLLILTPLALRASDPLLPGEGYPRPIRRCAIRSATRAAGSPV
jgi:hypothetical protein